MYHAAAPSPHHGPQPTGRLPPSSPSYAPGPSTHGHQQPFATSGSYYAPPPPPMQHPASSSTGGYPASSQHHHMPPSHRPPQPQHAPQHPTPAVPHHSLFLKIHSYTPASLGGLGPTAELVVACRLFPQPTAPQTSNVIRLCFGSYPVATRVARASAGRATGRAAARPGAAAPVRGALVGRARRPRFSPAGRASGPRLPLLRGPASESGPRPARARPPARLVRRV
jgi:hypothetical protein